MTIEVETPDGSIAEFPDGTSPQVIQQAMAKKYGAPSSAPPVAGGIADLIAGRTHPKTSRAVSGAMGFWDTALMGLPDEAAGFSQTLAGNLARAGLPSARVPTPQETEQNARSVTNEYRRFQNQAQQDNPWSYGGGQVAGSLTAPIGRVRTLADAGLKFGGIGAAHGFGAGDDLNERTMLAGEEGITSAAGGVLFGKLFGLGKNATAAKPGSMYDKVQMFDQAGVRPTMAAMGPGAATMTNVTGENAIGGIGVRARLRASLADTQQSAERLASGYGNPASPELAGARVREGVSGWQASFKNRAENIYSRALGPLKARSADAAKTEQLLAQIAQESGPAGTQTAEFVVPDVIKSLASNLEADRGKLTFDSLRALRTKIRTMQKANLIQPTIPQANLERIEGALTDDIYAAAQKAGGPVALRRLQQADKFYALGQQRIKSALAPFISETGSDVGAYQRILDMAAAGRRQNTRALQALKQSLKPDEWRDVASSLIDNLGKVKPGAPNAVTPDAFSINNFVTNYAKLSPEGRAVLFGNVGGGNGGATKLSAELDNLVKVAGMQKAVEAAANHSHSFVNASNAVTVAGVSTGIPIPAIGLGLLGNAATGEMLTNPGFVRWLASTSRPGQGVTRAGLRQLGFLAARDPALEPLYRQLNAQFGVGDQKSPGPGTRQPALAQPR